MQMHDRNDKESIAADSLYDAVGKPVGRAAAGSPREQRPRLRVLQDTFDGTLHFHRKLIPESPSLGLIMPDGFGEFDAGRCKKFDIHSLCRLPISSKTS